LEAINKASARDSSTIPAERPKRTFWMHRVLSLQSAILISVVALLLFLAVGVVYPRVATSGPISPRIALGSFLLASPGLPRQLPDQISQEVTAAFGAENAVVVESDTRGSPKAAPFVMDGSITKEGQTVRYTVNLSDRRSGIVLWSRGYDRDVADLLAPRQVAVEASQIIRCGLWGAAAYQHRMSGEGMSLYLKWCDQHWGGSGDDAAELDAARTVTTAVPDFSFGWSARALAAIPLAQTANSPDAAPAASEAREAAQRSIELDDQNPEGYMALAALLPLNRYQEREKLLKKAISVRRLECGCERLSYGDFLASVGRMNEAVEEYQRAKAKMPLAPFSNVRLAQALYEVGRREEADRVLSDTLEVWPDASDVQLLTIKSAFWNKEYDQALAGLKSPEVHLGRDQRDALMAAFEALKDPGSGRRAAAITKLKDCARDPDRTDRLIVAALAALSDQSSAILAAQQLIAARGHRYADVLFEPNLASAERVPAYGALVNQLGLASYWRLQGRRPDICRGEAKADFCGTA
jgi:tetratricopeptide (TPR) repeat protein